MVLEQYKLHINGDSTTSVPRDTIPPKERKQKAVLDTTENDQGYEIPPWYQFNPSDIDLILYYLKPKFTNEPVPRSRIRIREAPSFLSPHEIAENGKEAYFFCSRYRQCQGGEWSNRTTRKGFWKIVGADKPQNYEGQTIGFRQKLIFFEGAAPEEYNPTSWLMHEYRVFEPQPGSSNGENKNNSPSKEIEYILCKIYNKGRKPLRGRQVDDGDNSIVSRVPNHRHVFRNMIRSGGLRDALW